MFVNKMSVRKVSSFLEDEKVEVYPTFFGILRRCSMEGGGKCWRDGKNVWGVWIGESNGSVVVTRSTEISVYSPSISSLISGLDLSHDGIESFCKILRKTMCR